MWERPLTTIVWFGLVTGGLELGLELAQQAWIAQIPEDLIRRNRHYVWMTPVSNVLLFVLLGLVVELIARFRPAVAHWFSLRFSTALGVLALLLHVRGLYTFASVVLACGVAAVVGRWLSPRSRKLGRVVRSTLPALAVGLLGLIGAASAWVATSERRALAQVPPAKSDAPNVLLLVLDDVRAASLSLYGRQRPTTPNLERLARRGVVFTEARSTAPWTLPSHASMFTGRWHHELSVGWEEALDERFPTLAEVLGRQGYATAGFVGNTFYCNAVYGLDRGFARYDDAYENDTISLFETVRSSSLGRRLIRTVGFPASGNDWMTSVRKSAAMLNRDLLGWLTERPAGQPFFAFVNYYDAHTPFIPPEGTTPRFGAAALPIEERLEIDRRFVEWSADNPGSTAPRFAPGNVEADAIDVYRDSYESAIAYIDHQIGLLFEELQRRNLLENTVVIVTSDHGEHFGEHGLLGHGLSLYRDEVHVPLLILPPPRLLAAAAGAEVREPVSLRDLPATVAEMVAPDAQSPFPGRSLSRFLVADENASPETEPPVLSEVQLLKKLRRTAQIPSTNGPVSSLLTRRRVYIRTEGGAEELYDVGNDPIESDDLASLKESQTELNGFRETLRQFSRVGSTPVGR